MTGPNVTVTVTVTNTGAVAGAEVAQLYVSFPPAADEPPKLLKAFLKLPLAAGDSVRAEFVLSVSDDLRVWDVPSGNWVVIPGNYTALIGASSADIRATAAFAI